MKTIDAAEVELLDYYLSKGFVSTKNHFVMLRDLTEPIPKFPQPNNITINQWEMSDEQGQQDYLKASAHAFEGNAWSLNHLQWMRDGPGWGTFTAFNEDYIVGSVMIWEINEQRSATENIFVHSDYRKKACITETLNFLKESGKTEATLGVFADKKKAILLYQSLGYRMLKVIVELGLD
ncbi:ribosomal protein S18 acetylase RimI-like enzyme [Salirhabdus euzebyi]|uniref:Ribosomal protein S18 acetylase RimI-like enzyme n=1 Tax=Salirhabdus euzebyi TaxID=394506 RepID=A0A841Q3N7_9BACI|nr:GNAT family N-acetyltransferase [Salirhabdus euzebyi]MBB6453016.1 ribosomal protein S18 acetylase RimI-like enzyme [Salirhabdus euzebyi]